MCAERSGLERCGGAAGATSGPSLIASNDALKANRLLAPQPPHLCSLCRSVLRQSARAESALRREAVRELLQVASASISWCEVDQT